MIRKYGIMLECRERRDSRQLQFISQSTMKIKYIKGVESSVADAPSRIDSYSSLNVFHRKVTDVFSQLQLKLVIADICAFKVSTLFTIHELERAD